jgi:hypothetical protein
MWGQARMSFEEIENWLEEKVTDEIFILIVSAAK